MSKTKAIIIDIDGTLANIEHRRHLVTNGNKKWDEFFSLMHLDEPNFWCALIAKKFSYIGYKVLMCSGRYEKHRQVTVDWFNKHDLYCDYLFMRPDGDNRSDQIIKKEIYDNQIAEKYDVLFVIDDRDRVVKMWREIGLTCLQCAYGDF